MLKGIKINKEVKQLQSQQLVTKEESQEQKTQTNQEKIQQLQTNLISSNKELLNLFLAGNADQAKITYQKIQKEEGKYFNLLFAKSYSKRTDSVFDSDFQDYDQQIVDPFQKPKDKKQSSTFSDTNMTKEFKADRMVAGKKEFDNATSKIYSKTKQNQSEEDVVNIEYEHDKSDENQKKKPNKKELKYDLKRQQRDQFLEKLQSKKNDKILASCKYCLQNKAILNEQIISNGQQVILMIPLYKRYQDSYHFNIIPLDHFESTRSLDEEAYDEVRNFMKCLVAAFDKIDQEVIFFENSFNLSKMPHCVIECISLPKRRAANAEIYFKKAIDESESEWSVHHKIIELKKEKGGIRKQIPKGFPYFFVDFNLAFGYAHVVEDEKNFSANFAHEIIATILELDKQQVLHPDKYKKEEYQQIQENFKKIWMDFDWTQMLN